MTKYFDINNLILGKDSEHFFCYTCLVDRSLADRSYDSRYCKFCYQFLLNEWQLIKSQGGRHGKPEWLPITPQQGVLANSDGAIACNGTTNISSNVGSLSVTKTCKFCGTVFTVRRSTARYCSNKCRVAAYRKDKQEVNGDGFTGSSAIKQVGTILSTPAAG